MGEAGGYRYKAFISYSWADAKWGKWLHRALETYRTPGNLVGKETPDGPVPARLHPIFKDREEEAAGASIGDAVEQALGNSEFLIVVCSPHSARSQWVDHEIAWFKAHRDPRKILALIVDGEPGDPQKECFPRALTHRTDAALTATDIAIDAPLAADARESGDGKRMAKLKLAAAMLGLGLDELVRRDERRRTLRTRAVVAASLALTAVMSTLTWFAVEARKEAEFQRSEAEGLVEFMLTDLRDKLEPVGRLDALDVVGNRALDYYARQELAGLDADALGRRARALLLVGEVSNIRGDSEAALRAFKQAAATTGEQLARDPGNAQRIYDHAQSVFWVGAIAYGRGEQKDAETQFREYKRLADRLIALDPDNPDWQMESSYAETNLGVMLYNEGRFAEAETAFAKGLAMVREVAEGEGDTADRKMEVGLALNWLGLAQYGLNKQADSLASHREEVALYEGVIARDPGNSSAKQLLAVAFQLVGSRELALGNVADASQATQQSLDLIGDLRRIEPDDTEWQEIELRGLLSQVQIDLYRGRRSQARTTAQQAAQSVASLKRTDPSNTVWTSELDSTVQLRRAQLALADGNPGEAYMLADAILRRLEGAEADQSPEIRATAVSASIAAGDAALELRRPRDAERLWNAGLARLSATSGINAAWAKRARQALLSRLGRADEAARLAAELRREGDRHPGFRYIN